MHLETLLGALWAWSMGRMWAPIQRWRTGECQQLAPISNIVLSVEDVSNFNDQSEDILESDGDSTTTTGVVAEDEAIPGVTFRIPKSLMKCLLNSKKRVYWSHTYYQNVQGQPVKVSYATTLQESETIATRFLNEKVIGFDMEWKFPCQGGGIKENISLIQIACDSEIALFHIALHKGKTTEQLLAPSLRKIIESRAIVKTGVAVYNADGRRLEKYMRLNPKGFFELSHLYRLVKYSETEPQKCNKTLVSFATQVEDHLQFPMYKGDVRTSDWTKPLNEEQKLYAASDAYGGYLLYHMMEAKRLKLDPTPPRPEFAELFKPIKLAEKVEIDGEVEEFEREVEGSSDESEEEDALEALFQSQPPQSQSIPKRKVRRRTQVNYPVTADPSADLDHLGKLIYEALCANRTQTAKSNHTTPAYIAHNATFAAIAAQRPTDLIGLEQIKGIGPAKLKRYGEEWLDIVTRIVSAEASTATVPRYDSFTAPEAISPRQAPKPQFNLPPPLSDPLQQTAAAVDKTISAPAAQLFHQSPAANRRTSIPTSTLTPPKLQTSQSSPAALPAMITPSAQDLAFRRLYSALSALRLRLSKASESTLEDVSSDETLKALATRQPTTIGEICRTPGAGKLLRATKSADINLLLFMRAQTLAANACDSSISDEGAVAPGVKAKPIPLKESTNAANVKARRKGEPFEHGSSKKQRVESVDVDISAEELAAFVEMSDSESF